MVAFVLEKYLNGSLPKSKEEKIVRQETSSFFGLIHKSVKGKKLKKKNKKY